MDRSHCPWDWHIPDEFWAENGATDPLLGSPPSTGSPGRPPNQGCVKRAFPWAALVVLVAAVGACGLLMVARREAFTWAALAGAALTVGVYPVMKSLMARWRRRSDRAALDRPRTESCLDPAAAPLAAVPSMLVFYDPPPEAPEPQAGPLEERLLYLCQQDRHLFRRLLDYERSRHPRLRRAALLRLAIEQFESDNR